MISFLPDSTPAVSPTSQKLAVDGAAKNTEIYNIDGSNYFKLRGLGTALNFDVDYGSATGTMTVKSK